MARRQGALTGGEAGPKRSKGWFGVKDEGSLCKRNENCTFLDIELKGAAQVMNEVQTCNPA